MSSFEFKVSGIFEIALPCNSNDKINKAIKF